MSSGNLKKVKSGHGFDNFAGVISDPATTLSPTTTAIPRSPTTWFGLRPSEIWGLFGVSALVLLFSYRGWWPIGIAEAWGFVTGGICVWLA